MSGVRTLGAILTLLLCLMISTRACINDRDTLAEEITGLPNVVQVITGRFDRNPPLYYEMRLQRVVAELRTNPTLLSDYDDAGAACDRLGHDDQALTWMAKKRGQLSDANASDPAIHEQWYRFYANDGTFRVHRWIWAGANRAHIAEVEQARDEIAEAIKLKPDAHFGREKYQLQVMDWIVQNPVYSSRDSLLAHFIRGNPREILTGLTGLIVLGNAWESVDIFQALACWKFLHPEPYISYLAKLRAAELLDAGQHSLLPDAPTGDGFKVLLSLDDDHRILGGKQQAVKNYRILRAEAERWQARRTTYMMVRLEAGRHPDTDPTFWNDWHDAGPPQLSIPLDRRVKLAFRSTFGYSNGDLIYGILLLSIPAICLLLLRDGLKRRMSTKRRIDNKPRYR